jgi:hypothetical protein|tara:strand:+ start:307 stop:507 length:201 start_codon:yes stop_codon:yes gene_type:complete
MKTTIIDGKEIPIVKATKVTTILKNKKTGEVYKTEEELETKNIPKEDVQRDVHVLMPALDLFAKTK